MALTKTVAALDEWAEVAQNAVREGAINDVSDMYSAMVHIDIALSNTTAHTGTKIIVQVSSAESGDEDWTELTSFLGPAGTANVPLIDTSEAIGQTVIGVAATTGFEADETGWVFIEDTGTVADSEMALLVSAVAGVSITILDGITVAKDTSDQVSNIADNYVIEIPMSANRVRVIIDNTFDSNGATVHTKTRISKVTAI